MLEVVHDEAEPNEVSGSVRDEIVRDEIVGEATRQVEVVARQAQVSAYIDVHAKEVAAVLLPI